MNISPRQLRIFVALAQSLSFSRTADQFCVTQPTLSKIVRELEEEIGVRLFERTTRAVRLTPDGEVLVTVASRITGDFDVGITELEEVARRRTQRLSIAALPTLAATLLPPVVAALRSETPQALVRVHDVFTDQALDMLRARAVDLALTGVDVIHQDLDYSEILREPFVALCSQRHHTTFRLKTWSEAALAAFPLITMPRGTGTRHHVDAAFLRNGVQFRPALELQNLNSIARFVSAGCGVALLPLSGAQLVLGEGLVVRFLEGAPERSVGIVTRRDAELPVLAAKVLRALRQHAQSLAATEPLQHRARDRRRASASGARHGQRKSSQGAKRP